MYMYSITDKFMDTPNLINFNKYFLDGRHFDQVDNALYLSNPFQMDRNNNQYSFGKQAATQKSIDTVMGENVGEEVWVIRMKVNDDLKFSSVTKPTLVRIEQNIVMDYGTKKIVNTFHKINVRTGKAAEKPLYKTYEDDICIAKTEAAAQEMFDGLVEFYKRRYEFHTADLMKDFENRVRG